MPSNLQDGTVASNDLIEAVHVNQLFPILADLEDGKAFFRPDQGSANAYQVDFSGTPSNKNRFSAYHQGMLVIFKAANTNTGASTLQVVGPSGNLTALPLTKSGSVALEAGDIQAGQMVAAVCNDLGSGNFRFEMVNAAKPIANLLQSNWLFGNGSDGNVTVSSNVTLAKNMHYQNLTLAPGGTIYTNGFVISVAGTLSPQGGKIVGGSQWINAPGGVSGGSESYAFVIGGGKAGGNGGSGSVSGAGGQGSGGTGTMGGIGGSRLLGGAGGTGSSGSGGSAGPNYDPSWNGLIQDLPSGFCRDYSTNSLLMVSGGAGGGGGGGNGSFLGGYGGGGGGGGGCIDILASNVDLTNTGGSYTWLFAKGGNGGNGETPVGGTTAQRGGGGGGSGGAGGLIRFIFGTIVGSCSDALDVSGGNGGNGGNAGAGSSGTTRGGRGGGGGYSGLVRGRILSPNTVVVSGNGEKTDSPGPTSPSVPSNQTGTAGTTGVVRKVSL